MTLRVRIPRSQRQQDARDRVLPTQHVNQCHADLRRFTVRLPRDAHQAAHGLHEQVVTRQFGARVRRPEAGDRAIHRTGVGRTHGFEVEPELLQDSGSKILQDDVGGHGEFARVRETGLCRQVTDHRSLVAVHAPEICRLSVGTQRR